MIDWQTTLPGEVGLDGKRLDAAHDLIVRALPDVTSLLVVRRGRLVAEHYFAGDVHTSRDTQSVTKSVLSVLVGIALDRGWLTSVEDRLLDRLPLGEARVGDPRWYRVTVRHLLTSTCGLPSELTDPDYDDAWFLSADPVRTSLEHALIAEPGETFHYSNAGAHLLGALLAHVSGRNLANLAAEHLLGPLGVARREWPTDPQGRPFAGGSLHLTSREMATFGQFVLRGGRVGDRQLVSREWTQEITRPHVPGYAWMEGIEQYGYLWWVTDERGVRGWYATGYGGQYVAVFPELELVVVMTGSVRDHPGHRHVIPDVVLSAVTDRPV